LAYPVTLFPNRQSIAYAQDAPYQISWIRLNDKIMEYGPTWIPKQPWCYSHNSHSFPSRVVRVFFINSDRAHIFSSVPKLLLICRCLIFTVPILLDDCAVKHIFRKPAFEITC
jgi:hypothetical protein